MTAIDKVILVVEDEPMIRMLAVDMLNELGWSTVEAGSAGEALELVGRGDDDVRAALIDLGLPDRSGLEVVREIRKLRPGLPVVVTTGRSEGDIDEGLRRDEAVIYLGKPYQLADLETALSTLKLSARAN
jgi:CheY-like chemotaxis protein